MVTTRGIGVDRRAMRRDRYSGGVHVGGYACVQVGGCEGVDMEGCEEVHNMVCGGGCTW